MYNNQEIASKIKQTAKDKKISIKQLLEKCDLNVNYISQFANGRDMTVGNLYSIANYLGVSVDYLLGRADSSQAVTQINTGDVGDHSSVNVNKTPEDDELLAMIKSLNLLERSKVVLFIDELKKK